MATRSSVLAWRIPGTGEPGGLLSMGSHRVGHDWSDFAAAAAWLEVRRQRPRSTHSDTHRHIHMHKHPSISHMVISVDQHKRPYSPFLIRACVRVLPLTFKGWQLLFHQGKSVLNAPVLEGIFKSHISIVLTLTVFYSQISIRLYALSDLQRSERKFSDLTFTSPNWFVYLFNRVNI